MNKWSLNRNKTRFTLFHRLQNRDTANITCPKNKRLWLKRSYSFKFLGILVDEHFGWVNHINTLANKLSKKSGLLYETKPFLNAKAMKSLYFSFFHSYLKYGNIGWSSRPMSKLNIIFSNQEQPLNKINGIFTL